LIVSIVALTSIFILGIVIYRRARPSVGSGGKKNKERAGSIAINAGYAGDWAATESVLNNVGGKFLLQGGGGGGGGGGHTRGSGGGYLDPRPVNLLPGAESWDEVAAALGEHSSGAATAGGMGGGGGGPGGKMQPRWDRTSPAGESDAEWLTITNSLNNRSGSSQEQQIQQQQQQQIQQQQLIIQQQQQQQQQQHQQPGE
jgi:hypothetical protein